MASSPGSGAIPSGLSQQTLLLDSNIRDWVVIPLLVIMIAAGFLRYFVGILLKAAPAPIAMIEHRSKSLLQRCSRLRSGSSNYISISKWEARRRYMSQKDGGYLRTEAEWATEEAEQNPSAAGGMDPMNPMSMMEGLKGNMAFMVQNMIMMQGISHFFQGFILLKVPFPLTRGFKMMFQRGLELSNLDTSYVSSVSWYFLVMFGLRGFFRIVIGDPSQEEQETMMNHGKFGMHTPAGPQNFDATKALVQEADNLEIMNKRKSEIDDVEKRLLGKKYLKKKLQAKDDLFGYGSVSAKKKS